MKTGKNVVHYVAQYPDSTSIRTLKTKTQFLKRPFQFSVNEVFRVKAEHFSFKMKVFGEFKACETVAEDAVLFRRVNFSRLIFTLFTAQ